METDVTRLILRRRSDWKFYMGGSGWRFRHAWTDNLGCAMLYSKVGPIKAVLNEAVRNEEYARSRNQPVEFPFDPADYIIQEARITVVQGSEVPF